MKERPAWRKWQIWYNTPKGNEETLQMAFKDCREEWYDPVRKVSVTLADATTAAQTLAAGHLSGPVATHFLAKALASVAVLGAETEEEGETVILQMKCSGPLGGLVAEVTREGTLRGYTERKTLDDFDGMGRPDPKKVLGDCEIQVTRSVPGRIISRGISTSLDGYLAGSLQRTAVMFDDASVTDDVEVLAARAVMIEALADSDWRDFPLKLDLGVSPRGIMKRLGLANAELKRTTPLSFACRCSAARAESMLAALGEEERKGLPPEVDITCHMCGRTYTVKTK